MEEFEMIHAKLDAATARALREQGERLGLNLPAYARLLLKTSVGSVIERKDGPPPAAKESGTRGRKTS